MICEVCQGHKIITVPVVRPVNEAAALLGLDGDRPRTATQATMEARQHFRQFPCPACGKWAEVDRVKVMEAHAIVSCWYKDNPGAMAAARREAVHRLVDMLCQNDSVVRVTTQPAPVSLGFTPEAVQVQATIGVVAKSTVATIEERVAQHQEALAREVMAEAIAQIDNFGSYYGWEQVAKRRAVECINGALTTVLKRRKVREA